MSQHQYQILKECIYLRPDGKVVHHRRAGAIAELPDDLAASLGDAVLQVGLTPKPLLSTSKPPATPAAPSPK